ncbi:MAG: hypothetical protein EOO07_27310 [Chitinophagaceae bacterium]|nr:MAG: hypothetical protein EOO07_27310 [Chitinophagaceae bacterium]
MKVCLLFAGLMISFVGFAQSKFLPQIKGGTKMQYLANVNGQEIPVGFKFDSLTTDYVKVGWSVEGYGEGAWIMNKKSLQSANGSLSDNPEPGVEQVVPDDKIQLLISKEQWASLTKDKKFKHNNIEYIVAPAAPANEFKVGDKAVDAIYVESADKSGKLWILNNEALPLLLKNVGNVSGPDLTLLSIN